MKVKHILALFILASTLVITGALFKILHYAGARELLMAGMLLEIGTGLLLIWKLIRTEHFKDFMNK